MKEWFAYFFGASDTIEFEMFTLPHLLPILAMVAIIVLIYLLRDQLRGWKWEKNLALTLAFIAIICDMSYYWRMSAMPSLNPSAITDLPIAVCQWAVIFCSFLAVTKNQTLFDLSYFWLLSGSVFALITPTVISYCGPTRFRFYQFWVEHTIGYIILFYMMFVHRMRPTIKSAIKSYAGLVVMAVIAYFTNDMLGPGANYLFMARPEATPSILDILPPNFVLRLVVMAAAITAMYGVAYLPWYLRDRKQAKGK